MAGFLLLHVGFGCGQWGLLSSCGVQASPRSGFSSCRAWALEPEGFGRRGPLAELLCGTWNLPGRGTEPVSLALAGKFQPLHHQGSPVLMILYRLLTVPGAGRVFSVL